MPERAQIHCVLRKTTGHLFHVLFQLQRRGACGFHEKERHHGDSDSELQKVHPKAICVEVLAIGAWAMLSFAILMAGTSVSKMLLALRHMGISVYSACTYFVHEGKFLFPAILTTLMNELKKKQKAIWCGNGRFDSMGHSAKYGAYTMFCCAVAKIVHFELYNSQRGKQRAAAFTFASLADWHKKALFNKLICQKFCNNNTWYKYRM